MSIRKLLLFESLDSVGTYLLWWPAVWGENQPNLLLTDERGCVFIKSLCPLRVSLGLIRVASSTASQLLQSGANHGANFILLLLIIMYIYHALINVLSAHMIHINLNMIFYTHAEHSPTKTICIMYYLK